MREPGDYMTMGMEPKRAERLRRVLERLANVYYEAA
jgi:hypothetical protein